MQESEPRLADGTRSDSRAVAANSRLALNLCPAPPFESARSREVGNDVMRVTSMPGAARCSYSLPLRVIRSSFSPVRPTTGAHPRPPIIMPAADGCSALLDGPSKEPALSRNARESHHVRTTYEAAHDDATVAKPEP